MKEYLQRGAISFAISCFVGLLINLLIDVIVNAFGMENFISMSPEFLATFQTPVIAAYVNILSYGLIGATFATMMFVFDCNRLGYLIQGLIYFLVTAAVCMGITIFLWRLHHYPKALICTMAGYGVTYVIMGIFQFRKLKRDVQFINDEILSQNR